MTWNHRVMLDRYGYHTIREVYYHADGTIENWTADPVHPMGETPDELAHELARFIRALNEPVLNEEELA